MTSEEREETVLTLFDQIRDIVGDGGILVGDEVRERPADWLGRSPNRASAIVRPSTTEQLSLVMRLCSEARQPMVAAGGLTGLVSGARADTDEVQLSLERMRNIIDIDPVGLTMTVEAGVPLQAVHEAAAEHGLTYGVDLGARGSCTIGGNIATNAGGNTVIRYGMTRENVLGLEAVLGDGTVITSMNALLKNNAGYDLKQLFIGSEGTLGIVTKAVLRLRPEPVSRATAMLAIDGFENLSTFFQFVGRGLGATLNSFEVMWSNYYQLIGIDSGRHSPPPLPGGSDYYVIVEMAGNDAENDDDLFTRLMTQALEDGVVQDAVIAASGSQRDAIWAVREDVEGQIQMMMPGISFDVSMPIARMEEYVEELIRQVASECGSDSLVAVYGHIGDNNLHLLVAPRPWNDEAKRRAEELVYSPLSTIGGSVSAEHCIGIDKREWLPLSRSKNEIGMMHVLKDALDPHGLLNRGKVLSDEAA